MTEDEAKVRWCPFVQYAGGSWIYPVSNRVESDSDVNEAATRLVNRPKCIASGCMCWRTPTARNEDGSTAFVDDGTGYCGLAGLPR